MAIFATVLIWTVMVASPHGSRSGFLYSVGRRKKSYYKTGLMALRERKFILTTADFWARVLRGLFPIEVYSGVVCRMVLELAAVKLARVHNDIPGYVGFVDENGEILPRWFSCDSSDKARCWWEFRSLSADDHGNDCGYMPALCRVPGHIRSMGAIEPPALEFILGSLVRCRVGRFPRTTPTRVSGCDARYQLC
jgi:hypothetical protein